LAVSPATDLAALFIRFAAEGRDVAWLAEQFLLVAGRAKRIHVTCDPDRARSTADGPVRIDVVFANTLDAQYLRHCRKKVAKATTCCGNPLGDLGSESGPSRADMGYNRRGSRRLCPIGLHRPGWPGHDRGGRTRLRCRQFRG